MLSLHPVSDLSSIQDLKTAYLQSLIAPLDGMWDTGFINPSPHWEIRVEDEQAGYYAANAKGKVLQFYVCPTHAPQQRSIFEHVIAQETITHALASTLDPAFLSLCLDVQKGIAVHTYLYETHSPIQPIHPDAAKVYLRLVELAELERIVSFQQACLGGEHDLSAWLRGYSSNLIARNELYVLCQGASWIGIGECRKSDTQAGIADLGMMVHPDYRRRKWATYILALLRAYCEKHNLRAICSTTAENIGSQKAIARAGFVRRHRLLDVTL